VSEQTDAIDLAWRLARSGQPIDAEGLFRVVTHPALLASADRRTRRLAFDGLVALRDFVGDAEFGRRIQELATGGLVEQLLSEQRVGNGFETIRSRLVNAVDPNVVLQMLRELGLRIYRPASITVGGSIALMLDAIIARHTDDVDVVDEVPEALRNDHPLLEQMAQRYGLVITHFQSHYLPDGWSQRTRSLGPFGSLAVRVVDPIDVLTGKLFSRRTKDLDDFRIAYGKVDVAALRGRIASSTAAFRRDASLVEAATQNWYIVTGESQLPS
jgi:hypothetical protein